MPEILHPKFAGQSALRRARSRHTHFHFDAVRVLPELLDDPAILRQNGLQPNLLKACFRRIVGPALCGAWVCGYEYVERVWLNGEDPDTATDESVQVGRWNWQCATDRIVWDRTELLDRNFEGMLAGVRVRLPHYGCLRIEKNLGALCRVEVAHAEHAGQMAALQEHGFRGTKRWFLGGSGCGHEQANGESVPLDAMFTRTGEQLRFPLDVVNGKRHRMLNCQCTFDFSP